ncbi:MAG: T9SS type A sorting domain-containing protein [Lentimicrobium sp.]
MKKFLLSLILLTSGIAFGQISPENNYSYSGTYSRLSGSGYKFYLMDMALAQCRVFNTNHTLWKTLNLSVPAGNYLYDLKYLSEGLFTSDNSLCLGYVYYIYDETTAIYTFNAKIVKENGTELLSIPGCQYMEVMDLESEGVKLVAYCYDYSVSPYTIQTRIYSLPGQLTATENRILPLDNKLPFPNPALDYINIQYKLPAGSTSGNLVITDLQGKITDHHIINSNADRITLPTGRYKPGMYLYSVESNKQKIETGRFLVK